MRVELARHEAEEPKAEASEAREEGSKQHQEDQEKQDKTEIRSGQVGPLQVRFGSCTTRLQPRTSCTKPSPGRQGMPASTIMVGRYPREQATGTRKQPGRQGRWRERPNRSASEERTRDRMNASEPDGTNQAQARPNPTARTAGKHPRRGAGANTGEKSAKRWYLAPSSHSK